MMKSLLTRLAVAFALLMGFAPDEVGAQSTINPNIPAQNSLLSSAPIRGNFAAAASDVNSLYGILNTPLTLWNKLLPGGLGTTGQCITSNGSSSSPTPQGCTAPSSASFAATSPLTVSFPSGVVTYALSTAIDVFLIVGDSNAVGQGSSVSSPAVPTGLAFMYCADTTIKPVADPTCSAVNAARNANTGSMWPALSIAYGRKIGFVLTGIGGSTQASAADFGVGNGNWQDTGPGSNNALALTALNSALAAFTAQGYAPTFRGIIYIIGAGDAAQIDNSVINVGQYTSALNSFVATWRSNVIGGTTYPHLPIWMPIIGTNSAFSDTGYSQVRAAQITYQAGDGDTTIPFTGLFSFSWRGLMQVGTAHPTQAGYNIMGTAIGSALIPAIPANIPYQLFSANTGIGGAPAAGTILQVVGADGVVASSVVDAYASLAQVQLRRADTTLQAPSAVQSGEIIGVFSVQSYGASTFGTTNQGALAFSATQNHTNSAKGTQACIFTTANGAASPTCYLTVGQDGGITLSGSAYAGLTQCLHINSSGVVSGTGSDCGSGGGAVSSVANSDGTLTISPTTGSVVASLALGHANTWTAAQTYTNSDIKLLGSSTGATTFTSANAGASNFTATFPANTGTIAELNLAQTWTAVQTVSLNAGSLPTALTGVVLRGANADGTITRLELDSFGASAAIPPVLSCLFGRGTAASPTAISANDEMCSVNAWGYTGAATQSATAAAAVRIFAAENWSSGHQGAYVEIATTTNAATTLTSRIRFENDGGVTLPSSVTGGDKGSGTLNASGLFVNGTAVLTGGSVTYGTTTVALGTSSTSIAGLTALSLTSAGTATIDWNADTYIGRAAAATLRLGQADAASAVAQTLGVQNVVTGTSNTAGANFTIAGSKGTGTGTGGSLLLQTSSAGSTGTSQNSLSTRATILGNGNVGFGTETNPQYNFTVSQNSSTGLSLAGALNGLIIHGADGVGVGFAAVNAAVGGSNGFTRVDNTLASPTNLGNAETIGSLIFSGWGNGSLQGGRARILATTSEAWSGSTFGVYYQFDTTPAGGSRAQAMRLMGGAIFGTGTTDSGSGGVALNGLLADYGYSYQTPSTGFTITLGNNTWHTILDPAGTLATGTITMPASPYDGMHVDVRSSQVVTTLTVSPNSGQSIKGAPTTFAVGGTFTCTYRSGNTTWYC